MCREVIFRENAIIDDCKQSTPEDLHHILMDNQQQIYWFLLVSSVLFFFSALQWSRRKNQRRRLPPGPPGWPVVGNLFQMGKKPHESLFALSKLYGPLITVSLGMKTTVVFSSADMAKEVLKTHDQNFAGRTVIQAMKNHSYHESSLMWGQYGDHWRKLRRISTLGFFSAKKLQASQNTRRDLVFQMVRSIFKENSMKGKSVAIADTMYRMILNLIGYLMFSTELTDPNNPDAVEFTEALVSWAKLCQKPNLADFFPCLGILDLHGVGRQIGFHLKGTHKFLDLCISNRVERRSKERDAENDFLDALLDIRDQTENDLSFMEIRTVFFELLMAGSDTAAGTLEWAMAELLHNPHTMKRAQVELDEIVGRERRVEESDLDSLPYLGAVVKEVFRLHPVAPLLLPHRAESSCEIMGFVIPREAQVLVNVWAIGRDPAVWKEPSSFIPERFVEGEKCKIDFKGKDFELLPFGAGRRICVGLPLADKIVHLILASLIHSFDWSLPDGLSAEEMDMDDEFSIVLKKHQALQAIPTVRLPHNIY